MITNEWKHKYNVLIAYERKVRLKQFNDGNYQQQYFYRKDNQHNICSSRTYCRMEKDDICTEDAVYEFAAKKLSKQIAVMHTIDNVLRGTIQELYYHIERLEEEEAAATLARALSKMQKCRDVLYYEEYLWQFEMMKNYYTDIDFMMSEAQFQRITHTFQIFPEDYQAILMRFAYLYANVHEMEKTKWVFTLYDFRHSKLINNQISCIVYDDLNNHYMEALKRCLKLEEILEKADNPAQLLTLYSNIFTLIDDFDGNASKAYIEKAIRLTLTLNFHPNRLLTIYGNAGTTYIKLRDYKQAIFYLQKACAISNTLRLRHSLCIAHCYHMLHQQIPNEYLQVSYDYGDCVDRCIYIFFQDYDKRSHEENNTYILMKVAKLLHPCDNLYLRIMMDELYDIAKKTNRYKSYYSFRKKFDM